MDLTDALSTEASRSSNHSEWDAFGPRCTDLLSELDARFVHRYALLPLKRSNLLGGFGDIIEQGHLYHFAPRSRHAS